MFIVCNGCKRVIIRWPDNDGIVTRHCERGIDNLACSQCFSTCKIIAGDPPELCIHGRNKEIRCWECEKEKKQQDAEYDHY